MGVALNQAVQWDWMPAWRYRCCIVLTLGPSMTQFRLAQKVETPPIYSRNFLGLFEVTCYFPVGNPPFGQSIVFFLLFSELFKQIQDFVGGKLMFLGMRFWGIPFSDRLMSHIDQFFSRAGPPAATQESNAQRMQSQNLLQRHDVAKHTATGLDMADMGDADADAGFSSMNMYPSFVPEKGVSFFFGFRDQMVCGCRSVQL